MCRSQMTRTVPDTLQRHICHGPRFPKQMHPHHQSIWFIVYTIDGAGINYQKWKKNSGHWKKGPFTYVWRCILKYAKHLLDVVQGRAIRF